MGYEDDVALIIDQMLFEPSDRFRVEVVGRFVEQQDVGLFEQQARERDAALFTARQVFHRPVARRAAQCIHRDFKLVVERPCVNRVDLFLKRAHFFHQGIEIHVFRRIRHDHADVIETLNHVCDFADTVHDVFLDRLGRIELRLLREITDGDILTGPCFTGEIGVYARHDLHQRRFTRTVRADDADLGILIKLQVNVVEHGLLRAGEGLGHPLHDKGVLGGHRWSLSQKSKNMEFDAPVSQAALS